MATNAPAQLTVGKTIDRRETVGRRETRERSNAYAPTDVD